MSIDGPDLDLQALTELYTASDLPLRGVTFEQFTGTASRPNRRGTVWVDAVL